ncbi:MAG: SDR family NAD(P)-dependent oxidoreductase [Peptoniphilaceae bacterium]|nr:SDR family NAD(P)-dependent oxidoreductase [Peptoniphilaceae bacterium]MDY6018767.1 SDR family NAD(P)-dependent oxidoreductase [Anaerococcus sp.]
MIAIISGASSGIGREFAKAIDKKEYEEIWLIARRKARLVELEEKLKTKVKILDIDLLDLESFEIFEKLLDSLKPQIGLVVNAAGLGYADYFYQEGLEKIQKTLRLNCEALTKINYLVLDYMAKDSAIINIASVASFIPQPKFATYAASKAYVLSFSRALNRELRPRGINVCTLCPNPVNTEFFKNSTKTQASKIKSLGLENIETMVAKTLRLCHKKDLVTTHPVSFLVKFLSKILPHSFIMFVEKKMGMY